MTLSTSIPAVVLAGGVAKPEVRAQGWPEWRALAPVNGRPIIQYVLDALRGATGIGEIAVVGPEAVRPVIGDATLLPLGEGLWDNIATGLEHFAAPRVLLAGSDIPLLTPAAVDDYLAQAIALAADFVYPIITREDSLAQCPGLSRTYATLRDGTFTGGNIMLVNGPAILAQDALIRKAIAARKKPLQLARLMSLMLVLKLLTKRASIAELEGQVSSILHASAKALQTPYAEIGADLDSPDETPTVEALLRRRA